MRAATPFLTMWRLVLEASTPVSIGRGRGDGVNDSLLVCDANGLPMLPASSLAGVLRAALYAQAGGGEAGEQAASAVFGRVPSNGGGDADDVGQASLLDVSHGHLMSGSHQAVTGLPDPEQLAADRLLAPLLTRKPVQRQRTAINARGTAKDGALFDRAVLPAGHRFAVELRLWSAEPEPAGARWLDELLAAGALRVGGQTRAGLGALRVACQRRYAWDLRQATAWGQFAKLPRDLAAIEWPAEPSAASTPASAQQPSAAGLVRLALRLTPEAGFRFGDGAVPIKPAGGRTLADVPKRESRVAWRPVAGGLQGALETAEAAPLLIPAASVKGALSHRLAFHANCVYGLFAGAGAPGLADPAHYDKALHSPTVQRFFGTLLDDRRDDAGAADSPNPRSAAAPTRAGVAWFSDAYLAVEQVASRQLTHTSIDRFTGGVRDGFLFTNEDVFVKPGATQPLVVLTIDINASAWGRRIAAEAAVNGADAARELQALRRTLEDLANGRLALGADAGSGLGWFTAPAGVEGWEVLEREVLAAVPAKVHDAPAPAQMPVA